jgi:hypothetical protein
MMQFISRKGAKCSAKDKDSRVSLRHGSFAPSSPLSLGERVRETLLSFLQPFRQRLFNRFAHFLLIDWIL